MIILKINDFNLNDIVVCVRFKEIYLSQVELVVFILDI